MRAIIATLAAVAGLGWAAAAGAANPEAIRFDLRPGGYVEVAVVDREPVLGMRLVAPDGRAFDAPGTARQVVYARRAPTGALSFAAEPQGGGFPDRGWIGFNDDDDFACPNFQPFYACSAYRRQLANTYVRSVGQIQVPDPAYFRETHPSWRLRVAYAGGAVTDLPVPGIGY